ncbi:MAG: sodium:panthothenate symporter, partial [Kiritimatiellia bacterium]|nr:sodium:panthothenate symporter [Kiritimatiellia bacterium]
SRRYVRDVTDYLASGRVAGRYVISVGDLTAGLSVITLVAGAEQNYQVGMAIGYWGSMLMPIGMFMALSGYCVYRFRQTRCLSGGQFMELRYSRKFRIVACGIRTIAEMITNAIGPAVAVRFFIYFMGIPQRFMFLGFSVPTYGLLVALLLTCALLIIWPAGRISLLITDCFQGILSYPIFVVFTVFVLVNVSWFKDVVPVMLDRAPGESFLNPMDLSKLRDFNLFALLVTLMGSVLNRASWIGNDTSSSGRTAHEQKMAGILGTWRNGFAYTMLSLIAIFVIVFMLESKFADPAHQVRIRLAERVAEEVVADPEIRSQLSMAMTQIPVAAHTIGVDPPYSRTQNPDTPFLNAARATITANDRETGNSIYQKFLSLYNQMMMPVLLGSLFHPVLMGLFALLMAMLLLSTDDSRIFNASSTIVQDLILPLKKTALSTEDHLRLLKKCTVLVTLFFFIVSLFFAQLDYINMFVTIMTSLWLGAAGPIMVGGLYTRFGTTTGAWSALTVGSGVPLFGLLCQRNWADKIYPWLDRQGWVAPLGSFLERVSRPFHPYVVWTMNDVKFPINSMEIYFMAMVLGIIAYVIGSLLTLKTPFNLDRMLHRGIYSDNPVAPPARERLTLPKILQQIVGIDSEYTRGDKVIAWSVVSWSLILNFGVLFCGSIIWNAISPWPAERWGIYFFITTILSAMIVGSISTVWFLIGGIRDAIALFRSLAARVA